MDHPPRVGVLRLNDPGLTRVDQNLDVIMRVVDLDTALATTWEDDLFMVSYTSWDRNAQDYPQNQPRLLKAALPHIRRAGGEVHCHMAMVDFDLAPWLEQTGKVAWTAELRERFEDTLLGLYKDGLRWAGEWSHLYYTDHGARLIWVYSQPVDPEHHEGYLRGLVKVFTDRGLPLDPGCCDWTRLMRLPRVIRKERKTWESPHFAIYSTSETFDAPTLPFETSLKRQPELPLDLDPKYENLPKPSPEEARDLLTRGKGTSRWYKDAQSRSRGRDYVYCTFDEAPIAAVGARDQTIHQRVGEAVAVLYYLKGTTPQHVYALFLPTVEALEEDESDPGKDWTDVLWRAVCRYWQREDAKHELAKKRLEKDEAEQADLKTRILYTVRSWCDHPAMRQDDSRAWAWLSRRLVAVVSNTCYVMGPDGYFNKHGVPTPLLPVKIKDLGLDSLIPLQELRAKTIVEVRPAEILKRHGTSIPASGCLGCPGIKGSYIENLGDPKKQTLKIKLYALRRDIDAEYNPDVDQWLKELAGEFYEQLIHWIGHALDFSGQPICALSIQGWPGIGKKMLVQGLCECVDGLQSAASDKELTGQFQHGILDTPFVVVNEGWQVGKWDTDVADRFRHFVGGDTIVVNQKYMAPIYVTNPCRLILLANNDTVVQAVFGHRDLSEQDRQALIQRILHIVCDKGAARWLAERHGLAFTRGWIRGDGGQRSHFIVAKHFLWLHLKRKAANISGDGRMLVEGNMHPALQRSMRFRSGISPQVVECILKMISQATPPRGLEVVPSEGKVYVTTQAVLEFHRKEFYGDKATVRAIRSALNAFNCRGDSNQPYTFETEDGAQSRRRRWIDVDLEPLLDEAIDLDLPTEKVERLVDTRKTIREMSYRRNKIIQLGS